ncbi:hypothetical protein QUF80_20830 [Desulfococcaceae bacterium HSG8]|nr:hypothetical protein [Desulfococcaceae bacterium HSG8]
MAIRNERERAGPCCSRGIDKSPACAGSDLAIRTERERAGPCCSRGIDKSPACGFGFANPNRAGEGPMLAGIAKSPACAGSDLAIRTEREKARCSRGLPNPPPAQVRICQSEQKRAKEEFISYAVPNAPSAWEISSYPYEAGRARPRNDP